jgi:hypothetical protein
MGQIDRQLAIFMAAQCGRPLADSTIIAICRGLFGKCHLGLFLPMSLNRATAFISSEAERDCLFLSGDGTFIRGEREKKVAPSTTAELLAAADGFGRALAAARPAEEYSFGLFRAFLGKMACENVALPGLVAAWTAHCNAVQLVVCDTGSAAFGGRATQGQDYRVLNPWCAHSLALLPLELQLRQEFAGVGGRDFKTKDGSARDSASSPTSKFFKQEGRRHGGNAGARRAAPPLSAGNSQNTSADSGSTPNAPTSICKFGDTCRHSNCNRSHPSRRGGAPAAAAALPRSRAADGTGDH